MLDLQKAHQRVNDIIASYKAYLALTQKDKTKITKTDKRRLGELEFELSKVMEPDERSNLVVDTSSVAKFFGVSPRSVQVWVKEKRCPRIKHGLFDLQAVFAWWNENIASGSDSMATEDIKQEYWRWKTEYEKTRVLKEQDLLIPSDIVTDAWAARVVELTGGLAALAERLPPLVVGKSRNEVREIIRREVWELRDNYSRPDREFCQTPNDLI